MRLIIKFVFIIALLLGSLEAKAVGVGDDSRIRTFVYGENDIFKIYSVFGYQTIIEFDKNEKIQTISVGNSNIFKLIPTGTRLFIKALINGQTTNMTVITDIRTYQFDISSAPAAPEDQMYLVRFVYPEDMEEPTTQVNNSDQPMNLYSHVSVPKSDNMNFSAPSLPKVSAPSLDVSTPDVPLSIKYRSSNERGGFNVSPVSVAGPSAF